MAQDVAFIDRLTLDRGNTAWMDQASCKGDDPSLWFPEPLRDTSDREKARYAADLVEPFRICNMCPVRVECYEDARSRDEVWGIWGGVDFNLTKKQRAALKAARP